MKRPLYSLLEGAEKNYNFTIGSILLISIFLLVVIFVSVFNGASHVMSREISQQMVNNQIPRLRDEVTNIHVVSQQEYDILKAAHPEWSSEQILIMVEQRLRNHVRTARKNNRSTIIVIKQLRKQEGGEDYASLRIHSALSSVEGSRLSTTSEFDTQGFPLKEALRQIQEQGYAVLRYDFRNPASGQNMPQLAYSMLFPEWNWVVSVGIDLTSIYTYSNDQEERVNDLMGKLLLLLFLLVITMVSLMVLIIRHKAMGTLIYRNQELKKQINWDAMTSANSRVYGEMALQNMWEEATGENASLAAGAVMILDVDNFKHFNDTYGHEVGDQVLRSVVQAVRRVARSSDRVIRWGGDEFVGLFPGVAPRHIESLMNKILDSVSHVEIPLEKEEGKTISIGVSIGFAYIHAGDKTVQDVLNRADEALYEAKKAGKNQGRVCH